MMKILSKFVYLLVELIFFIFFEYLWFELVDSIDVFCLKIIN